MPKFAVMMRLFTISLALMTSACFSPATLGAEATSLPVSSLGHTISVPLDYDQPKLGHAPLYYEFGAAYNKAKPTVFIVSDAQQFYVRKGAVAGLQRDLFGDAFNVVGIVTRGTDHHFTDATRDTHGQTDWVMAWRIFNSDQYLDDIETVRKTVVGEQGKILLYGASGGGFLTHQYLAKYGVHVSRAFTASALNPFLEGELGLVSDHFWEEVGAYDPALQPLLQKVLKQHQSDRATLVMTLQRQNFFVPADKIQAARADLIRALAAGDQRRYEEAQEQYQVPQISKFFASDAGIPIRVRLFEFFYPTKTRKLLDESAFYPDLENQYNFAKPLVALCDAKQIPAPAFDFAALHHLDAEVFVLAGRQDHTADYRALIALAECYPQHNLFIVNDNHNFSELASDGSEGQLRRAFLQYGLNSSEMRFAEAEAQKHRWNEAQS